LIENEDFKGRHREREKDFTRVRSLPFALVLLMRKSMKSLQNVVNDVMTWLNEPLVTASAYSQARFWVVRVLAVDASKLLLPDSDDVRKEFGTIARTNDNTTQQ
jgi:hypothetical protein